MFPELPIQTLGQLACVRAILIELFVSNGDLADISCDLSSVVAAFLRFVAWCTENVKTKTGRRVGGWYAVCMNSVEFNSCETCVTGSNHRVFARCLGIGFYLGAQSCTFYLPNMSIGQDIFHVCRY
jgi:hypothetical protein